MPKPVLPAKRRRKGFESVRKGGCTANARPLFFEKELFYCKLTVASGIRNGLLHVSLGAVGSLCRGGLRKSFSLSVSLASAEKVCLFRKPKAFLLHKPFLYSHPKQLFSTLHLPFAPPLTYCPKRIQPFFCCSLNSLRCKVRASHRFKSLPAIPGEVAALRKTGYLMNAGRFRKNTLSTGDLNRPRSPEVRKPLACFLVLFARRKKHEKRSFRRKLRGFANLESAHRSRSFALQQLKPFKGAPRF